MDYKFQFFGTFVVTIGTFNLGTLLSFPTIALPQWKNEATVQLKLNESEGALFVTLFMMVGIICSPIGGTQYS